MHDHGMWDSADERAETRRLIHLHRHSHVIEQLICELLKRGHKSVAHLNVGAFAEEPRGTISNVGGKVTQQIRSGTQARAVLSGVDSDGAPADVSGATLDTSAATGVTATLTPNGAGGDDLVVADVVGANLGPAGSITINPPAGSTAVPVSIDFEIVQSDAVLISVGPFTEEPRV